VSYHIDNEGSSIDCEVRTETLSQTGVEMEALTAVQVALLTIYDMCKAVDRGTQQAAVLTIPPIIRSYLTAKIRYLIHTEACLQSLFEN